MGSRAGYSPWYEFAAACLILIVLAFLLLPMVSSSSRELPSRTVCMSNLASIGKALTLYRGWNENQWPWIANVRSDWSAVPTGTNRGRDPGADPNDAGDRAITSLMFVLVRDGQPAKLFVCPSTEDRKEPLPVDEANTPSDEEPPYFWDFSSHRNVSYSWQAPIWEDGGFGNGVDDGEPGCVIMADRSPGAGPSPWNSTAWDPALTGEALRPHVGPNHGGRRVNFLRADWSIGKSDRPDVGADQDMIFTASGRPDGGSRSATSVDIRRHLSPRDSFLIGPVAGDADDMRRNAPK